jgi:hypothetical protein
MMAASKWSALFVWSVELSSSPRMHRSMKSWPVREDFGGRAGKPSTCAIVAYAVNCDPV